MTDSIRSEWIKLRSVRANVVISAIALGAPIVLCVLIASLANFDSVSRRDVFGVAVVAPCLVASFLVGVLGVLGIGQEYRHNTIRVTFAAQPRRSVVLAAKCVVYGIFGLSIGVVTPLACLAVGGLILSGRRRSFAFDPAPLVGLAVFCALMTLFGFGLGAMMRQPAGAIPVFLIWPLIVEGLVGLLVRSIDDKLVRWLPFQSGQRMAAAGEAGPEYFGRAASGVYFAVWTAVIVALGWWLVERRDA